jgi:hypothetical protein
MGAWPSDKAIALKNLMRESSGSLPGDIYKAAKVKFGDLYMTDPSRRDKWYTGSIKNMRGAMQLSGYDVFPGRNAEPTPAEIAKMPPTEAMEAKRRAFNGKGSGSLPKVGAGGTGWAELKSGAKYIGPDGKTYTKGIGGK